MNETKANLTLKQRQRLQGKVQSEKKPQGESSSKELPLIAVILLLLLAFGGGTALGMMYFRPDARLQELEDMDAIREDQNTPEDVQRGLWGQSRELADSLPSDVRQKAGMDEGSRRIAQFFAKSSAEQLAMLKERHGWGPGGRGEGGPDGPPNAAPKPADASQANGGANSNNNNGGGKGGKNDQQRAQAMEQRISNHPPQQRAQFGLMMQMRNAIRQQAAVAPR